MKLSFQKPHLSINDFPDTELPNFTLLTGLNGSGKTHFLRAIQQGAIAVPGLAPERDIRYFDWTTLTPRDSDVTSSLSLEQEKGKAVALFKKVRGSFRKKILDAIEELGLEPLIESDSWKVLRATIDDLTVYFKDRGRAEEVHAKLQALCNRFDQRVLSHVELRGWKYSLERLARLRSVPVIGLDQNDFDQEIAAWGQTSIFEQTLGQVFVQYRDLALRNMNRQTAIGRGRPDVTALTDEEFIKLHLGPPWDFVNAAFSEAGLDFSIDRPPEFEQGIYKPRLTKRSTKVRVDFNSLSSGEAIIMSFALCLYHSQDKRQLALHPKLLLFDEIDAPLHPSQAKIVLRVILETLVKGLGVDVIATTHAPTTVALAPEESLYVIEAGRFGVHRTTKAQALNVLTVGVPTISISHEGRRQVLVESPDDAELYSSLYQILKGKLRSERSLQFMDFGIAEVGAPISSGCEAVQRLVTSFTEAGARSVLGLIDWDGKNKPTERVAVLACGQRNGLENVLLDPLIVAAAIVLSANKHAPEIGIQADLTYPGLLNLPVEQLQQVVDLVQKHILGSQFEPNNSVSCGYIGGFSLNLQRRYLEMDDHELMDLVLDRVPALHEVARGRPQKLRRFCIDRVMFDKPAFTPSAFFECFEELLGKSVH